MDWVIGENILYLLRGTVNTVGISAAVIVLGTCVGVLVVCCASFPGG